MVAAFLCVCYGKFTLSNLFIIFQWLISIKRHLTWWWRNTRFIRKSPHAAVDFSSISSEMSTFHARGQFFDQFEALVNGVRQTRAKVSANQEDKKSKRDALNAHLRSLVEQHVNMRPLSNRSQSTANEIFNWSNNGRHCNRSIYSNRHDIERRLSTISITPSEPSPPGSFAIFEFAITFLATVVPRIQSISLSRTWNNRIDSPTATIHAQTHYPVSFSSAK